MWMIGIGLGAAALLAGRLTKKRRLRRPLRLLGAALLAAGLIYGGLTMLLLGGALSEGSASRKRRFFHEKSWLQFFWRWRCCP